MPLPLLYAHAGHVVLDSIVYGGPVVVIAAAVLLFAKFERRLVPGGPAVQSGPGDPGGAEDTSVELDEGEQRRTS